jgi:cyclopropane fatty-acyl-phospholipid synthase-like methyltransferase
MGKPHAHHHHHGRYGNPEDLADYVARQEAPARSEWQKPDRVVKALGLRPGQTVCEIGAGPGYFSLRLARKVGRAGRVYAVEVEPPILEVLRERIEASGLRNITPILGLPDDPLVPRSSFDLVLITDTYHHFPNGPAYLKALTRLLRHRGRIVNIDFHRRETPVGPPVERRVAREDFLADARRAGLALVAEHDFLPHQYFVVLAPRSGRV